MTLTGPETYSAHQSSQAQPYMWRTYTSSTFTSHMQTVAATELAADAQKATHRMGNGRPSAASDCQDSTHQEKEGGRRKPRAVPRSCLSSPSFSFVCCDWYP
jgi:hypothetical protein